MKENGKSFQFAPPSNQEERMDADYSIELLLKGNNEEFKDYCMRFPPIVNVKDRQHGNIPLHIAASRGDAAMVTFLIRFESEINTQDIFGNTALHYATDKSKLSAMDVLLSQGANANLQDYRGNTPIHLACINNDIDAVRLLLFKYQADPEITDYNEILPREKSRSPIIRSLIDKKLHSLHGGDEQSRQQTMQWMSLGVGLGVGLGVAMAKSQQLFADQLIQRMEQLQQKSKRRPLATAGGGIGGGGNSSHHQQQQQLAATSYDGNEASVMSGSTGQREAQQLLLQNERKFL